MTSSEQDVLLLESFNSFGKQHHLNQKRKGTGWTASVDGTSEPRQSRAFSQPLPDSHQHSRERVIQASGGVVNAMWFDASACQQCATAGYCGQHNCAGSPSSRSDYFDTASDGSSAPSLSSSAADGFSLMHEGQKRAHRSGGSAASSSLDESLSAADFQGKLLPDKRRPCTAEEAPAELRQQREQLTARLRNLEAAHRNDVVAACDAAAASARAEVAETSEVQVAVARLVAGAFGHVTASAAAEAAQARRLAALQRRIEMLTAMQSASGACSAAAEEPMQRRLMNAAVAVACTSIGVAGAYLLIRKLK